MSNLELFKGNPLVKGDLFKSLMETNKRMAGGGGGGNRISIRGGRFRLVVGGEEVSVRKEPTLNVMIVNASGVQRTYYKGAYDPKADKANPPTCWSADSKVPAPEVPDGQRQAPSCDGCKMNIKGSGQGDSRACRFSQRLAVMLEGDTETIYAMQVPAASIFGAAKGSDMGLQAYVKFLNAHDTPVQAVLTEMSFDTNAETPKLFFKPARPLEEDELNEVVAAMDSAEATNAITLTVNVEEGTKVQDFKIEDDEDDEDDAPPPPKKKAAEKRKVVEVVDEDDDEEEDDTPPPPPKKKAAKPAPTDTGDDKLSSLLAEWDDDEDDD
jgi:hypothetical protein